MSIAKIALAGAAALTLISIAGAASAEPWGGGYHHSRSDYGDRSSNRWDRGGGDREYNRWDRWGGDREYNRGDDRRRDDRGGDHGRYDRRG